MQTRYLVVGILLVAFFGLGCGKSNAPTTASSNPNSSVEEEAKTIEFDGRTWQLVGPAWDFSNIPRHNWMDPRIYIQVPTTTADFLLECVRKDDSQYERILTIQREIDGKMLRDGPSKSWMMNGEVIEDNYKNGKLHGNEKVYYKNGKIKFDRNYVENKLEGKSYGYNEDGSLDWEATYKDNKQIDPPVNQ